MKPIRVAVVGAGHLGRIHTRLVSGLPQFELVAVVDPIEPARRALAEQYNTRALADYHELAGMADAVVLAAPTSLHHRLGLDLLDAGMHLLIEKPLATGFRQACDLVDAAQHARRVLQVGHVERFSPVWNAALPHLAAPKYIEASRCSGFTFRCIDVGVVLDLMIHDLDLVLSLVQSPVERVDALGVSVLGRHEDAANARLQFRNGCVAVLTASRLSRNPARSMSLYSAAGQASLNFTTQEATFVRPGELLRQGTFDAQSLPAEEQAALKDSLLDVCLPQEKLSVAPGNAIELELIDFAESIRQGRPPRVSGEQAREVLGVAEQVLGSIHSHAWNGQTKGPVGPRGEPAPSIIPAPHWRTTPAAQPTPRREVG